MLGSGDGSHIIKLRGLPFSTTIEDVLDFLNGVNVLNEKDGVHLTEVRPGRPSGECFVEVQSQEDVEEALKKDKENMGKRYIEVFSTDRQDMEWALNAMRQSENGFDSIPNVTDDVGVVKLRGLPFGCSKEEIVQFFSGLTVAPDWVHLLSDHTGRASGEAFVYFVDKQSAQDALNRDREKIGHRYIEVFMSSADEMRAYRSRMESGGGFKSTRGYRPTPYDRNDRYGSRFGNRGRGSSFGRDPSHVTGGSGGGNSSGSGGGGGYSRGGRRGGSYCVHMRGLPFKATPQDIAYFFKPIRPMNINILYDNSGRPSGEADVEFECHEDAMRAMRRDKNNMDHRYIELFLNSSPGSSFKPTRTFRNY
ncbi:heterogeneous nuclear ribonucleoprotein H2-like isoform X1 [Vanessa cardui]|uniref:heterogeneous nuclear ribonucleoprotein H2-like isoform X1 n=1 Tax=Vanessa cardui TaxID=171605 RepID=UPI001F1427D4|nr:heterogeneous nuclear ribonucleoprotein H2-like isoform X1 [Vanessa cardui]